MQVKGDVDLLVLDKTTQTKYQMLTWTKREHRQPALCIDIEWNFNYFLFGHICPLITWTRTGRNPFWSVAILADFSSCCRP